MKDPRKVWFGITTIQDSDEVSKGRSEWELRWVFEGLLKGSVYAVVVTMVLSVPVFVVSKVYVVLGAA